MSSPDVLDERSLEDILGGDYPEVDMTDERLWELYVEWCAHHGVKPKFDGYQIWLSERYP